MATQIPLKVLKDGSDNTCGLAQFTSSDSVAIAAGGTGLNSQGICEFVQPGLYAVGCQVTYLGICAGKADTGVGHDNTYAGHSAGTAVTTGCQHTIIGSQAGKAITTCSGTVAIGYNAGLAQTFGDFNTLIGTAGGAAITTASNNTVIGYHAATATICSNNIAIGTCAMVANTQGQDNIAIGVKAGATQVAAGCNNVFVGSNAGAVSLCRDNVSIGSYAGKAATTGGGNVMIGACVGYGVVGGASNVYIGDKAGLANTSGNANVFIGNCAGCADTGSCCLIIGNGTCDIINGSFATGNVGIGTTPSSWSDSTSNVTTGVDLEIFGASGSAGGLGLGTAQTNNDNTAGSLYFVNTDNSAASGATAKVIASLRAIVATSDSNAGDDSGGSLWFQTKPEAGSIATTMAMTSAGNVGIGTTAPDGTLHVFTATAGSITAAGSSDDLVVENNNHGGISILTPNNKSAYLHFGDVDDADIAGIEYSHYSDSMRFYTNAAERVRIDSSGNVGIGTTAPNTVLQVEGDTSISNGYGLIVGHTSQQTAGGITAETQVLGTGEHDPAQFWGRWSANNVGPYLFMLKSRGASIGSNAIVQDDDYLGIFAWYADDGTDLRMAAYIEAQVAGTPGTSDMPARLLFGTTADGSGSPTKRMTIESTGDIGIGTAAPAQRLHVQGNLCVSGSVSKGSGSFRIEHPLESKKETHRLVHSFTESPQADLLYTGWTQLTSGAATINIDMIHDMTEGTFVALNRCIRVFTSNESDWDMVKGSVTGNQLTIESNNSSSVACVSWLVIGERCDKHIMETEWTDINGRVIVEPEIEVAEAESE